MAAPVLQVEGATSANTSGDLTVSFSNTAANDVILLCLVYWGPNTIGDVVDIPTPSGYTLIGVQQQTGAGGADGRLAWFWKRSGGGETSVTCTRGSGWDTGTDTNFGGRVYLIRGCITTGDPWDAAAASGPHTAANQAFPAVTVSGSERMVVQFGGVNDNLAFAMTSTGWTTGTEDNDPAGTDCSFQTARKDNIASSTSADTATVTAPGQGGYGFTGISFKPPSTVTVTTDFVTPLEFLVALADDNRWVLEFGVVPQTDKTGNMENLVALAPDKAISLEYLTGLQADKEMPLEILAGFLPDYIINLEFSGLLVVDKDGVMVLEFLSGLADDGIVAGEFGNALLDDNRTALEFLSPTQQDLLPFFEWLADMRNSSIAGLEFLQTPSADGIESFEFKAAPFTDAVLSFEFAGQAPPVAAEMIYIIAPAVKRAGILAERRINP